MTENINNSDNSRFENFEEMQYLQLVNDIITRGNFELGRNGNTYSIFGSSMRFSLENNKIPILTSKKVAWKTCLKELLWFINGKTDNNILQSQNVHIWDANASQFFLEKTKNSETNIIENDLGPIYGHQWRHFNATYTDCHADYTGKGVDQLQYIIDALKNPEKRFSRRLVMSSWNPCQLNEMALPTCHVLCQFIVAQGNKLSCALYQRSNDEMCGTPFNIASYCFLTHLLAKHCGLEAYEFIYFKGNCHIYENHIDGAKIQIKRKPFHFPTVSIKQVRENIDDYVIEDFEIHDYQYHESIKYKMVA